MAATKINLTKISMHFNANVVRGRSYEKFFAKIYHTKLSLHENFQIYGNYYMYDIVFSCLSWDTHCPKRNKLKLII